ncbi:hypothetical protein FMM75_08775 [Lachnospiraceae bacterium MD335]|nr:hypothetical protein [Lachnospiraceae bacterium MD335]
MEEKQKSEPENVQDTTENAVSDTVQDTIEDAAPETVQEEKKQSGGSIFEGIYDRLPDMSVRSVDRFIILCVIALIAVILIGVLKANHVF